MSTESADKGQYGDVSKGDDSEAAANEQDAEEGGACFSDDEKQETEGLCADWSPHAYLLSLSLHLSLSP